MTSKHNNELTLDAVKMAVYSWSLRFPEARHTGAALNALADEYLDDLRSEGVTRRQFDAAAAEVRKRCRFYPKMCDILDAVQRYRESPARPMATDALQLADLTSQHDLTPEEIARNQERIKVIADMLAGKMSMEEAVEKVEKLSHIHEFGGTDGQ